MNYGYLETKQREQLDCSVQCKLERVPVMKYSSTTPWNGMEAWIAVSVLTSTLDEDEWSDSCTGSYTPGKGPAVVVGNVALWAAEPV
jgi:hypothetical protein